MIDYPARSRTLKRVVIVQTTMRQYRVAFFEQLSEVLGREGIDLRLLYGAPDSDEAARKDSIDVAWGEKIRNRVFRVGGLKLIWQPCIKRTRDTDLVVVEQASKLLTNYALIALQTVGLRRVAFWGHGKNFEYRHANRFGEFLKRLASRRVHWWFAYNDLTTRVVESLGYPRARITSVQNAIDTNQLVQTLDAFTERDGAELLSELGLSGTNVCIFAGSLVTGKRIDYLLEACQTIRSLIPDFEMIIIGAGPEERRAKEAHELNSWIRFLGPRFGRDKVPYFAISRLLLMPGGVGLGILDAFALMTPIVTTAVPGHGPEIDYLEPGSNGICIRAEASPQEYAAEVATLLNDSDRITQMAERCAHLRGQYTVEEMARRFAEGVRMATTDVGHLNALN